MKYIKYALLFLAVSSPMVATADEDSAKLARECFDHFAALEAAYDPQSVSLIDDNADVEFTLKTADGATQKQNVTGKKFKEVSLQGIEKDKRERVKHVYKDIKVTPAKGDRYLVTGGDYDTGAHTQVSFSTLYGVGKQDRCTVYALKFLFDVAAQQSQQKP